MPPSSRIHGLTSMKALGWSMENHVIKKKSLIPTFSHPEVNPAFTSLIIKVILQCLSHLHDLLLPKNMSVL